MNLILHKISATRRILNTKALVKAAHHYSSGLYFKDVGDSPTSLAIDIYPEADGDAWYTFEITSKEEAEYVMSEIKEYLSRLEQK